MTKVIEVNKSEFSDTVLASKIPTLVDFWAPWCGPCRMMSPILDELSQEMDGKIKIVKINVEDPDNRDLAIQYQIMNIPNMKLFKDGKVIKEFIGLRMKEELKNEINAVI